ncbi:uncharacterized protein EV420DRAFT_921349 [Desarmillaria tabescens]|uniref:Uncharacterized protein n=1 Tax=Armillaria tabescens TaxID=1929756 RepID=A0AA39MTG9_ARMTA|nr:uncharacterized protein EV420DRAFT_921349 [Desarmillaria tabescens]KAK0445623.1 hypothetical protein EV420DRAFT_921349 [Desarmillaria tabescens]
MPTIAAVAPGEPKASPKPQPIGNVPMILLLTTCVACVVFLLWRRANQLKSVISHQLKTWRQTEGQIRLSTDDGPAATEFLEDDYDDDDNEDLTLVEDVGGRLMQKKSSVAEAAQNRNAG